MLRGANILTWHHWLSHSLSNQQYSALLASVFQAVAKCSASLEPDAVFRLRSWGLRCLIGSSPLKADAFWDQAGKYSVSFIKSDGTDAWQPVEALLDELIELASQREDKSKFFQGRGFTGICEYRLKFARAVSDLNSPCAAVLNVYLAYRNGMQPTSNASSSCWTDH